MFKIISSEVCLASAPWLGSNALKWWPCRGPPPPREPCALRLAHLCNRLFLETVIRVYCKMHYIQLVATNTSVSCQKCARQYFHPVADKGLIYTIMTTSRINLMAQAILLHSKLCKMYRVYRLNYILKKAQVNMKNTNFGTSLLWCNQLFLEWVHIIKYF